MAEAESAGRKYRGEIRKQNTGAKNGREMQKQ